VSLLDIYPFWNRALKFHSSYCPDKWVWMQDERNFFLLSVMLFSLFLPIPTLYKTSGDYENCNNMTVTCLLYVSGPKGEVDTKFEEGD